MLALGVARARLEPPGVHYVTMLLAALALLLENDGGTLRDLSARNAPVCAFGAAAGALALASLYTVLLKPPAHDALAPHDALPRGLAPGGDLAAAADAAATLARLRRLDRSPWHDVSLRVALDEWRAADGDGALGELLALSLGALLELVALALALPALARFARFAWRLNRQSAWDVALVLPLSLASLALTRLSSVQLLALLGLAGGAWQLNAIQALQQRGASVI